MIRFNEHFCNKSQIQRNRNKKLTIFKSSCTDNSAIDALSNCSVRFHSEFIDSKWHQACGCVIQTLPCDVTLNSLPRHGAVTQHFKLKSKNG